MEMNKHQKLFLDTTMEYTRQINQLLMMAATADSKQIMQFTAILNKLKSSLQKLQRQQPKFKRYVDNPARYEAMLKPYLDLLESTKAEIEGLKK